MSTFSENREVIDHYKREAVLFSSGVRALTASGFTKIDFDIGGKKARRRYVTALSPKGESVVIWIKSSTHWHGHAEVIRFPWKKLSAGNDGLSAILVACEAAAKKSVTHLLAVAGNDKTGVLAFARLYQLDQLPKLVSEQAAIINSVFYRAHSASLIIQAYSAEFNNAANAAIAIGEDILSTEPNTTSNDVSEKAVRPRTGQVYLRDPKIRKRVLEIANGYCECCGVEGFLTESGHHYLETHHVVGVSERGPDSVSNVVAVCPTCHRKAHFAADRVEIGRVMFEAIYRRGRLAR